MTITTVYIKNSKAIDLILAGRLESAVAEWKDALSTIKHIIDSNAISPDRPSIHATISSLTTQDVLIPIRIFHKGIINDSHITSMFCKVFTPTNDFEQADENLLVAILLYNMAVAFSLQRQECSDISKIFKLYRLSLQILSESGLIWNSSVTLLLMALYNNIAYISFCAHEIKCALESIENLSVLLTDESVKQSHCCADEDFKFFHMNTVILVNDMNVFTSPAA